jgi:RNA polymerase sigma-70 factor (ECF subfamily)
MKTMADPRCKQIFAVLSEYLDGELPVKNCRELERHLKGCQPCLAYLENLKTTIQACRKLRVRQVPKPSAVVRSALLQAVRRK